MKIKKIFKRKSKRGHIYNLQRDKHDNRDHRWSAPCMIRAEALPSFVDHTPQLPPPYTQGQWGTCYANAAAGILHGLMLADKASDVYLPSRLFIAWNACAAEGRTRAEDGIASLRNTIDPIKGIGFTDESSAPAPWSYVDANLNVKPADDCFKEASKHLITSYERIEQNLLSIKAALAEGHNIICGVIIYPQFESPEAAKTGIIDTPGWLIRNLTPSLGGHAIVLVGYDDKTQMFKFRNSWGMWGDKGYGYLPYDYITNTTLACDFWVINAVQHIST